MTKISTVSASSLPLLLKEKSDLRQTGGTNVVEGLV
jgi:hypothetical protein